MAKTDLEWWKAIFEVLMDHKGKEVSLQTIYQEVSRYRILTDNDLQKTYGQENYKHTVRSLLTSKNSPLVKDGLVVKLRRGVYAASEKLRDMTGLW